MTSLHDLFPLEHYHLPFCHPSPYWYTGSENIKLSHHHNLGQFLSGDRIKPLPYKIEILNDMYCEQVCFTNVGRMEMQGVSPNKLVRAIRKDYHNNWIVDNIPSAYKGKNQDMIWINYFGGFPIGFVDPKSGLSYVNNHVNIEIEYHHVEGTGTGLGKKEYRIVRFTVQPFSIKHDFTPIWMDDDDGEEIASVKVATINNPIASCDENINRKEKPHTSSFDMVSQNGHEPQLASGKVLFTYDVIWKENKEVSWPSRWDIYLSMNYTIPSKVHWISIVNSLMIVLILTTMVVIILVRNLRRDYDYHYKHSYCCKAFDNNNTNELEESLLDSTSDNEHERNEDIERSKWRLVHADVFRQPKYPLLISVFTGTGVQLLCMTSISLVFAVLGFLNPARRGSWGMALLTFYILSGRTAGYVTARMYKRFEGENCRRAIIATAFGFPSITFGLFIFMNLLAAWKGSSLAVPFSKVIILLFLWFGISAPLVCSGAYAGFDADAIEFPVETSNTPRQVPSGKKWSKGPILTAVISGYLPLSMCCIEFNLLMSSVWMEQYYNVYGILFIVFIILIVTVAEISVIFNYIQLCDEDYHWWWRSFINGGAFGLYVFGYSFKYFFKQLKLDGASCILYFGYMGLICFGLFLMCGSVGLLSCLYFNKKMFASTKSSQ